MHVIREDAKQKGLLFAGTETTVYVSFDDSDHWQSLRLNLPSTSSRDMVVHSDHNMNDLVIGMYGRGFWVLDDMNPLRQLAAKGQQIPAAPAYLFKPGDAIRARANADWDQPMNLEMPHKPSNIITVSRTLLLSQNSYSWTKWYLRSVEKLSIRKTVCS